MNMRLIYGPSIAELAIEAGIARAERMAVWRKKRQNELERGDDVDALADSMDVDPGEWQREFAALLVTPTVDRKILKMGEIKARLVQVTLDREQENWGDE